MDLFSDLESLHRIFWYITLLVSVIFVILAVMTFAGMDSSDGLNADFDGDLDMGDAPFQLFTFRNLINFLLGFGWTGVAFYQTISNKGILIALAVGVGAGFVFLFFIVMRQIQKLAENNTFNINSTLQKTGEVYLTIPGQKQGKGKVQVSVKGSFRELDAVTEEDKIIPGTLIRVCKVESDNLVVVQRL